MIYQNGNILQVSLFIKGVSFSFRCWITSFTGRIKTPTIHSFLVLLSVVARDPPGTPKGDILGLWSYTVEQVAAHSDTHLFPGIKTNIY